MAVDTRAEGRPRVRFPSKLREWTWVGNVRLSPKFKKVGQPTDLYKISSFLRGVTDVAYSIR